MTPDEPQRDAFVRNLIAGCAVGLLLLGASVLAGWFASVPVLVTWGGARPAVPANGALGLMIFGVALLGRVYRGRLWSTLALVPAAGGLWSLLELWPRVPSGFDQWLLRHGLDGSATPGRLVPVLALSFLLAGAAVALLALGRGGRIRLLVLAVLGSLVGAAGLAAILGHATGLATATTLGLSQPVALPMATGLLVLGCGIVASAVAARRPDSGPARWLPLPLMLGCAAATVIVWLALRQREAPPVLLRPEPASAAPTEQPGPPLSNVVLGSGLVFALLLGLVVDLAQKARYRQLQAEAGAGRLLAEDRERREVESRLKRSEERLSLALEAGQVGTFDWDTATGQVHFSPGVWRMLGYDPAQKAPRLPQWDGLVHPRDAGNLRRDFGRTMRPGYLESEYRVRNAAGEWRWILERAKGVAFAPDGTARRIAGTFQDISQRKQVEESLRVSQSEARKLAIVASITDNLVAITDAAGRIEWVNESFTRQLGGSLGELSGRPIIDVLPPPPGEPAGAGEVRQAFTRRLPTSTEIATLARNGQPVHLHLELQPVTGERGEIDKFIAVLHDITARIETERNLRLAKTQAEAATRAKSDFLASMSHEIRTPMNGVIGLAGLLLDSPLNAEQEDWVRTIRSSGDALVTIINEILDFSKIESGRMELERYPFQPADCVEEVLDLFAAPAGAKGVELSYWVGPGVPESVVGDVARLRQVLVNLVGNALKFTAAGRIAVEVRPGEAPAQLAFTVTDTGIGIPQDRRERLFQPFYQGDASTTRHYGGTGLGLAICRRLVELMGGTIGLMSTVGKGSVFHFTVQTPPAPVPAGSVEHQPTGIGRRAVVIDDDPVAQRFIVQVLERDGYIALCYDSCAAAKAGLEGVAAPELVVVDHSLPDGDGLAAVVAVRAAYPEKSVPIVLVTLVGQGPAREDLLAAGVAGQATKPLRRHLLRERILAALAPREALPVATAVAEAVEMAPLADRLPLQVLLAEDNPVNKKVALRLLERLGYQADYVPNGSEAVKAVAKGGYQLVFMDVQMPELDGLEATRRIRESLPKERQPVIVALTANAIAGDAEICRAAGMDDYVSKPVTPEDIYNVIVRHFGRGLRLEEIRRSR